MASTLVGLKLVDNVRQSITEKRHVDSRDQILQKLQYKYGVEGGGIDKLD